MISPFLIAIFLISLILAFMNSREFSTMVAFLFFIRFNPSLSSDYEKLIQAYYESNRHSNTLIAPIDLDDCIMPDAPKPQFHSISSINSNPPRISVNMDEEKIKERGIESLSLKDEQSPSTPRINPFQENERGKLIQAMETENFIIKRKERIPRAGLSGKSFSNPENFKKPRALLRSHSLYTPSNTRFINNDWEMTSNQNDSHPSLLFKPRNSLLKERNFKERSNLFILKKPLIFSIRNGRLIENLAKRKLDRMKKIQQIKKQILNNR